MIFSSTTQIEWVHEELTDNHIPSNGEVIHLQRSETGNGVAFPIDDSSPEVLGDGVERRFLGMGRVIIPVGIDKVLRLFLEGRGGVCRGEALG